MIRVEGRKDFLENEIKMLLKEKSREQAKEELKRMMLFDKLWMRLSQSIALIEEEVPRLQLSSEKILVSTIRIFVKETRKDLQNFENSI